MATDATDRLFESRFVQLLQSEQPTMALRTRLLLAIAVFAIALCVRFALLPVNYGSAFFTFYPAVVATAAFLGVGPGLLVILLSALAADFFFLPPYHSLVLDTRALPPVLMFVISGALICWLAHVTRRSLATLRAARNKLFRLQEALPVGLVLTDMQGRFLDFNSAFSQLTGYSAAELRRLGCEALTPSEYAAEDARQLAVLSATGRLGPYEKDYLRRDGTRVPIQVTGTALESADGQRCIWSVVEDMTERRRVQSGLEQLLREQKMILDSRVIGIVRVKDRYIVWANQRFAEMFGYTLSEIIGQPTRVLYPSDEAYAQFANTAFPVMANGAVFKIELQQVRKGGDLGWFEKTCQIGPGENERIATFMDVTERHRVSFELQQARADLQAILDHVPARITSWNLDGTNCFANRFAEQQFGIGPGSAAGRHVRAIIGEERYRENTRHIQASLSGKPERYEYEQIDTLADGSKRYSHVASVPKFRDGKLAGTYVLATDVTDLCNVQEMLSAKLEELKHTTEALRESENRLRAITDNIPLAIALYDSSDRIQFANRQFRKLMGRGAWQPDGATAAEYLHETVYPVSLEPRERARQGEIVRFTVAAQVAGAQRHYEITYVPYRDASGVVAGVYGMGYDVTETREAHARIRELAVRLATVREDERRAVAVRLHEGLAQELYAAHLSLHELERKGRGRSRISDLAKELSRVIDQGIEDVRDLTNHLYPTSLVHLPLLRALEHLAGQFAKRAGLDVVVRQLPEFPDLDAQTRVLFFRTAQEALANVARHAAASSVSISLEADSERIAMLVTDDGRGIAVDDLHKAGSLGLLGIRERFAAVGGGLVVDRSAPSGTCLTVFVPASAAEAAAESAEGAADTAGAATDPVETDASGIDLPAAAPLVTRT